ncbi:hypothetical protein H9Q09_01050 [Aurantimonas sp. DM33-3]|uniref:hypothetical protein n=1 Tax=Aurantimonas sp. DM33-3 TaxID=2766955 RepID=UPI001652B4A0|nr:hypothetical protein [Aurantimonas sp. DM33-3]MBC6714772.1 hypothetical protein [Aurantimonas sp. DM33-3]
MTIIPAVIGAPEERTVMLKPEPSYDHLKELLAPIFQPGGFEHLTVLYQGERRDMFVGENSALGSQPRNITATAIYRNAWLTRNPLDDPESLPPVCGAAVLFSRRVWF